MISPITVPPPTNTESEYFSDHVRASANDVGRHQVTCSPTNIKDCVRKEPDRCKIRLHVNTLNDELNRII